MEPTEKNTHNTWLKVKYDIETDGQVTNIELVDSYKASHKVKVDTINVIKKWNFPKSNAKNGNIVIIYFRPAPSV